MGRFKGQHKVGKGVGEDIQHVSGTLCKLFYIIQSNNQTLLKNYANTKKVLFVILFFKGLGGIRGRNGHIFECNWWEGKCLHHLTPCRCLFPPLHLSVTRSVNLRLIGQYLKSFLKLWTEKVILNIFFAS